MKLLTVFSVALLLAAGCTVNVNEEDASDTLKQDTIVVNGRDSGLERIGDTLKKRYKEVKEEVEEQWERID